MQPATRQRSYDLHIATLQFEVKAARQAVDWDGAVVGIRRLLKVPYRRLTSEQNEQLLRFTMWQSRSLIAAAMQQRRKWYRGGVPAEDLWLVYLKSATHLGINRAEQGHGSKPFRAYAKRAERAVQLFPSSAYIRSAELRLLQKWLKYETDYAARAEILRRFRLSYCEAMAASPSATARTMPRIRIAKLLHDEGRLTPALIACRKIVNDSPTNAHAVNMLRRWQNGGQLHSTREPK